jgi:oxygen-independent coproporphyrinogen-3 oxidase
MSGIYLHIPFCRKACHYCNFHFSTSLKLKNDFIEALLLEIDRKKNQHLKLETIYFGGGTPSLLEKDELLQIFNALNTSFNLSEIQEITLECNPEDINSFQLQTWLELGINRLSIGVQSLNNTELQLMNRNHLAEQSKKSVQLAVEAGFQNLTLDLIYGTPWKSIQEWENELRWALNSGISHLSAYALTVEPKTALSHQIKKKEVQEPSDERMTEDFMLLQKLMLEFGWDAYEISNYCKPGQRSKHNSNYWKGSPYLGLGPSAHSFDGELTRSWNISNNALYIEGEKTGIPSVEFENLSLIERCNELIMTKLRTKEGLQLSELGIWAETFKSSNIHFLKTAALNGWIIEFEESISLTNDGKLISDYIISELMLID